MCIPQPRPGRRTHALRGPQMQSRDLETTPGESPHADPMRVSPVRPLQDPRVTDGDRQARPPLTGLGGGRAPCEARRRGRHGVGLRKAASSGAVHFSLVLGPAVRTLRVAPSPLRPERRGARLVGRNATVRVSWRPALSAAEDQRRPEVRMANTAGRDACGQPQTQWPDVWPGGTQGLRLLLLG